MEYREYRVNKKNQRKLISHQLYYEGEKIHKKLPLAIRTRKQDLEQMRSSVHACMHAFNSVDTFHILT